VTLNKLFKTSPVFKSRVGLCGECQQVGLVDSMSVVQRRRKSLIKRLDRSTL